MIKFTHFFTIALSISALGSNAQSQPIVYGSQPLNWNHFSMRKSGLSNQKATNYAGINYSVNEAKQKYVVHVQAYFDASQSMVVPSEANPALLLHEQKLFDLTELFARKMRADVSKFMNNKTAPLNFEAVNEKVKFIYSKWNDELIQTQQRYKLETDHGKNQAAQAIWNKQIDEELEDYSGFAAASKGL
jgi:hypothetical protein